MRLKIRCAGEYEKFCKIFWKVNKAYSELRRRTQKRNEKGSLQRSTTTTGRPSGASLSPFRAILSYASPRGAAISGSLSLSLPPCTPGKKEKVILPAIQQFSRGI